MSGEEIWAKATCSATNGNCVEVCTVHVMQVLVRDSKNPRVILSFEPAGWRAFLRAVKAL